MTYLDDLLQLTPHDLLQLTPHDLLQLTPHDLLQQPSESQSISASNGSQQTDSDPFGPQPLFGDTRDQLIVRLL